MAKVSMLVRLDDIDGDGWGRIGTPVQAFSDSRQATAWCGNLSLAMRTARESGKVNADAMRHAADLAKWWPEWAIKEMCAYIWNIPSQTEWYSVLEAELDETTVEEDLKLKNSLTMEG